MKTNSEILCSENGIELLVTYEYEKLNSDNPNEEGKYETTITNLELVVSKFLTLELKPALTKESEDYIISLLTYE
jgi:hypothetical protein